jgi:hypothetical protein
MKVTKFTVTSCYGDGYLIDEEQIDAESPVEAASWEMAKLEQASSADLSSLEDIVMVPTDAIVRVDFQSIIARRLAAERARVAAEAERKMAEATAKRDAAIATLPEDTVAALLAEAERATARAEAAERDLAHQQTLAKNWERSCEIHAGQVIDLRRRVAELEAAAAAAKTPEAT